MSCRRTGASWAAERSQDAERLQELVRDGELDAAIQVLLDRHARTPAEARYLAWLEQRRGEFGASLRTLDALLAADPADAESALLRTYAQWYAGDVALAAAALERIGGGEDIDPGIARRVASDLERVRAEMRQLDPVAAAARRVDAAYFGAVTLVVVAVISCALWAVLRRAGR